MPMERVSVTPNIAWNDVRILQMLFYQPDRVQIVFRCVIRIDDQFHTVLVHEIFVFFLHEAYDYIDFFNPHFMKLPDGTFDQCFPIHFQETFRHLGIDWNHSHAKACCQNNSSLWGFLLKFCNCFHCWTYELV